MRIKFVVYIVFFSLVAVVSAKSMKTEKTETTEVVALTYAAPPIHREIVSEKRAEEQAAEQARIDAERVAAEKAEAHRQWHLRQEAKKRASPPRPSRSGIRASQGHVAASGDILDALARCESGGDPGRHSLNGKYHGAFQFLISTWQSIGYEGDPHNHSYATQKEAAGKLIARSGWASQFPRCARKLGMA